MLFRTSAIAALALATACSSAPKDETNATTEATTVPSAHVTYYGGPLLAHANVIAVYWGSAPNQAPMNQFYATITQSTYFDWLSEYSAGGTAIGRGTFGGAFVVAAPTSSTISDGDIGAKLKALVANGTLPPPDANTLYMNHFAPTVTITMGGASSCQQFCAYHSTIANGNGVNINYAVVPDMSSAACASGCGLGDGFGNTTHWASNAMLNAVTDPAVGLASTLAPPVGWIDGTSTMEIGNVCASYSASVGGYRVSKAWSQRYGACIASTAAIPAVPTCTVSAASTCGFVSVSCNGISEPEVLLRKDPGATTYTTVATWTTTGSAQLVEQPPSATATYRACSVAYPGYCTADLPVTVAACTPRVCGAGRHDCGDGFCVSNTRKCF